MRADKIYVWIIGCLICVQLFNLQAQDRRWAVSISNNTSGLPIVTYGKLFYSQFHPGIDGQMSWQIIGNEKNRIYARANLGIYYHQFVQTLFRAYPMIAYERSLGRFSANVGLGGGYGLSFEGKNAFVLQDDGTYSNKKFGGPRSQFLITLEIGGGFALKADDPSGPQIKTSFLSYLQGVYVNSYVPLLPINTFQIGVSFPFGQ